MEGGEYKVAHQWVIEESSGSNSNIYLWGIGKFTSIFILRKCNGNLLSSGILRQNTINSSG